MSIVDSCIGCGCDILIDHSSINESVRCGLMFTSKNIVRLDYSTTYSDECSLYNKHYKQLNLFQTTSNLNKYLLPFEKIIINICRHEPISLIDIGCGTGRFLRACEKVLGSGKAKGYEISEVLVSGLKKHGRNVINGGIEDFIHNHDDAESITMLEVIEHLPTPRKVMLEIYLRKNIKKIFIVVPLSRVRRKFDKNFAQHDVPPNHLSWWDERSLSFLLQNDGYKVSVFKIPEKRKSMLGHLYRNGFNIKEVGVMSWIKAIIFPPGFWLLGIAERIK